MVFYSYNVEIKSFFCKDLYANNCLEADKYCRTINNEMQSQFLNESFRIQNNDFKINEITNLDLCFNQTEN